MKWICVICLGFFSLFCCQSDESSASAYEGIKTIEYNGTSVDVIISKPALPSADVIVAYHGTVFLDSKILGAAQRMLEELKKITTRNDIMFVSVAYPEENLLMGDNLKHAEAALLWVKHRAAEEMKITVNRIYLVGHSQGGYLVTRLNALYATDGVIANGPGPLDLAFRCQLEAAGQAPRTPTCTLLSEVYGTPVRGEQQYFNRSLLNYVSGFQSKILFVQGLKDSAIQLNSWPVFKNLVQSCSDCKGVEIIEVNDAGHEALFESNVAQEAYNQFIGR